MRIRNGVRGRRRLRVQNGDRLRVPNGGQLRVPNGGRLRVRVLATAGHKWGEVLVNPQRRATHHSSPAHPHSFRIIPCLCCSSPVAAPTPCSSPSSCRQASLPCPAFRHLRQAAFDIFLWLLVLIPWFCLRAMSGA